jgi:hypothetical protein
MGQLDWFTTWLSLKSGNELTWRCRGRSDRCLGKPKKGGAGGKFNWGATVDLDANSGVQDSGDPNYDSSEEADRHMRLKTTATDNSTDCKKEAGPFQPSYIAGQLAKSAVTTNRQMD